MAFTWTVDEIFLAKPNKYRAKKTMIDNIVFDSKAESQRYLQLKLLFRGNQISNLELQPEFHFCLDGKRIFTYRADFSYFDYQTNQQVIEDVKGVRTPVYRLKKKLIEAQHGITVREV